MSGAEERERWLDTLEAQLRPLLAALGLEVVEISYRRHGRRWLLRVDIDRPGPAGASLEDCERASRTIGTLLDEADPVPHSYVLEVSSPGLDRPIETDDDLRRNRGRRVVLETDSPVHGRQRFVGILLEGGPGVVRLEETPEGVVEIPRERVRRMRQEIRFS